MKIRYSCVAACLVMLSLAACGGGGGDGSPSGQPASNPAGDWLTFTPSTPAVTQYEGESAQVTVKATSSRTFTAPLNVAIIDAAGVISEQVSISALSQMEYAATLNTAASLDTGTHTTTLEVRVCEDEPRTCAKPFPGSPWRLPLTVDVKPRAEATARLSMSVPSVSVITFPGEAAEFSFEAQLNKELASRLVNIGVFDPAGITVARASQVTNLESGRYVFKLATANALPVGTYTSNLQVRLCEDDVITCRRPVAGSPWIMPLTVTVKSPINLTALDAVDGLGSWTTYQGNASHTGFANASFDPAAFSRRWKVPGVNGYDDKYSSLAIDGGRAFFVRPNAAGKWELLAVSEDTGKIAWRVSGALGNLHQVNAPAAANGRVYVTSSGYDDTSLWVFDQATGAKIKQIAMSSRWFAYSAPTIFGGNVYTIDGYYGDISRYFDEQKKFSWQAGATADEGWTPSTDGRFVYSYSTPDNTLSAYNAADGSLAYSIGTPYPFSSSSISRPVLLTDKQQAIVVADSVMAFDLSSHTRSWALSTGSSGGAAYGNGTVYIFERGGRRLKAHNPANGALLWTSADLGSEDFSDVIVTRNLAFVSSYTTTHAIDLATREVVWTYPVGGNLAISQRGVLYILDRFGALAAVNLR